MGDRQAKLAGALERLKSHPKITLLAASRVYETEPLYREDGDRWFLNQVLQLKTALPPTALLAVTQNIEKALGRAKSGDHKGPRTIDIDLLVYGEQILDTHDLKLPHPGLKSRRCIMTPLVEIAPDLADPVSGTPYKTLLTALDDPHKVTPYP